MLGNKNFSGIDFRDNFISCATVKMERGIPVLQKVAKQEETVEIIEGGRVTDTDLLISVLSRSFKEGWLCKRVHLAIPTQNILLRKVTTLPDVGEAELRKLLQFHIGESIHLPFENPIYDFVKLGSIHPKSINEGEDDLVDDDDDDLELSLGELAREMKEKNDGPKSEVLLFATSKLLSQEVADVLNTAGLKPLSAEIRALALQRLLTYVHPRWLHETEMIIDASEKSVDIHIFKENLIGFSRRLSINPDPFQEVAENNRDEDLFIFDDNDLTNQLDGQLEVAAAKIDVGNSREADSYLNEIILEVERAQNFFRYSLNERESEVKRMIVTGDFADQIFEPLKSRMESVKVDRIDYSSILAPDFSNSENLDSCSVAIGLAMRGNEKIRSN